MKKYFKYLAIFSAVVLFNCESTEETTLSDFVGFEIGPFNVSVPADGTNTIDIDVYASEVSSQSRSFNLEAQSKSDLQSKYDLPETVTIPANSNKGTFTVSVTDDGKLGYVKQDLVIGFKSQAGLNVGNPITIGASKLCEDTLILLDLAFDSYPDETTVQLFDLSGADPVVIYDGGPYDGLKTAKLNFCLTAGKYGVAVFDQYGDGGATYTVTGNGITYVAKTTSKTDVSTAIFIIE